MVPRESLSVAASFTVPPTSNDAMIGVTVAMLGLQGQAVRLEFPGRARQACRLRAREGRKCHDDRHSAGR